MSRRTTSTRENFSAGVVLPRELRPRPHLEVALRAAELPEDLLRLPVDLVDRVRVPGRDEEVAVRLDVDRVEVDVVIRRRLLALLRVRDGLEEPVFESDRGPAVPLEEHLPGPDVHVLDDPV